MTGKIEIARGIAKALDNLSEFAMRPNDDELLRAAMEKLFFAIEQLCDTDEQIEIAVAHVIRSKALDKALARTGRGLHGPYKREMWKNERRG